MGAPSAASVSVESPPALYTRLNTSRRNCENGMRTICHFPVVANGAMNVLPSTPGSRSDTEYRFPSPFRRRSTPSCSRSATSPRASPDPRSSIAAEICATPVFENTKPSKTGNLLNFPSSSSPPGPKFTRCATSAAACHRPSLGSTNRVSSTVQSKNTSRCLTKLVSIVLVLLERPARRIAKALL